MLRTTRWWLAVTASDIEAKLKASELLKPVKEVSVVDASGGCGSFFKIAVTSPVFRDRPLVQQHRLVNAALKEEIAVIHGFSLTTNAD